MKRIVLIFFLLLYPSVFGMWHGIKKWLTEDIKQEQLECAEFGLGRQEKSFAFTELPLELQQMIGTMLGNFKNIESASNTLRALGIANKQWSKYLTPPFIVQLIAKNYNISPILAEWYVHPTSFNNLNTKTLTDWIIKNPAEFYRLYQDAAYLDSQVNSQYSKKILNKLRFERNKFENKGTQWVALDGSYIKFTQHPNVLICKSTANKTLDQSFGGTEYNVTIKEIVPNLDRTQPGCVSLINLKGTAPAVEGVVSQVFSISGGPHPFDYFLTSDFAVLTDGKIVVLGLIDKQFVLVRLNADGSLDQTFANQGLRLTNVTLGKEHVKNSRPIPGANYLRALELYVSASPSNDEIVVRIGNTIKKYTADGKELK